mmetsp:Transcript_78855/g.152269  ORF Transcript_78855/g.152269 Transcript_78855/m.152269 type:complete len:144 (+) Transcript_78855:164-595(+)
MHGQTKQHLSFHQTLPWSHPFKEPRCSTQLQQKHSHQQTEKMNCRRIDTAQPQQLQSTMVADCSSILRPYGDSQDKRPCLAAIRSEPLLAARRIEFPRIKVVFIRTTHNHVVTTICAQLKDFLHSFPHQRSLPPTLYLSRRDW